MKNGLALVIALFVIIFGGTFFYGLWKTSEMIHNYTIMDRISSEWIAWTIQQYAVFLLSSIGLKLTLQLTK